MPAYRKRTMRAMPPNTRALAKLATELASISRRLGNAIEDIRRIEEQGMERAETTERVLKRMQGKNGE